VLCISTLYAYDTLLMPTRFWTSRPPKDDDHPRAVAKRPPSSATLVLQQRMVRIWTLQFTAANALVFVSFTLLACAILGPSLWLALTVLAALGAAFLGRRLSALGSHD
jgi:hypothetical protein